MHPNVYSSTINNSQSMERAQMSINRWMDKEDVVYICTMEYYLAIKKSEILSFATMWMELEGTMLREIIQSEKDIIWFHSYEFKIQNRWISGKGSKNNIKTGKGAQLKRLLNTEEKNWGLLEGCWVGNALNRLWTLRRALFGMSTGCYIRAWITEFYTWNHYAN